MNKREAMRQAQQENTLLSLGFTLTEATKLRRISMTLHRWHELECGDGNGCIERDEVSGIPQWRYANDTGRYCGRPIADREKGALKRLGEIISARNARQQWETREGKIVWPHSVSSYIQTDPRGAALYIIRPGDIPEGQTADSCYSRGICVY